MGNNAPRAGLLAEDGFRAGLRTLGALGYSFDAMVYHTQIRGADRAGAGLSRR